LLDKGLFDDYEKCLQDEPSATAARCPVHIDVPEFCAQIARGNFEKAYAVLQKRIPFAGVFCLVCDHPCQDVCVRNPLDCAVRIGHLERAAVRYGYTPFKKKFKTSKLQGKVAVVGGGISGLSAAFDLDRRGYAVTLFEQSDRLGGWLWQLVGQGLTAHDIEQGLEAVYQLAIELRYGQQIDTHQLALLQNEYDAVFLGTGHWPEPVAVDPATFRVGSSKLCVGGTLAGSGTSVIAAVSSGKRAAITLERILKNVSLNAEREREAAFETLLPKSLDYVKPAPAIEPASGLDYTREEAMQEAARCLRCECDECVKACAHMQRYGRKPKTYAREIYTNENVFLGTRYANKMINSCTLCGLCGQRCPLDLSMAPLVSQTRKSMVANEKMPPSAHDFALRDMAFSNSEQCALMRTPSGATHLFFPGCQLSASGPQLVEAAFRWLCDAFPKDVGLWLGCCGAPASWAGRDDLLAGTIAGMRQSWLEAGEPTLILACSSCKDVLSRHLPEIPTTSLWEVMAGEIASKASNIEGEKDVATIARLLPDETSAPHTVCIHDACSTRHDARLQESVRTLVKALGLETEELRYAGADAKCCGFGGLVFYANREQEGDFARDRAQESPHDLVVYCAMCKDLFASTGKPTYHLLDLLFPEASGAKGSAYKMPTLSERQANRAQLKRHLLRTVWGQDQPAAAPKLPGFSVVIPPEVQAVMDQRLILSADIEDALAKAIAEPGERFYNPDEASYLVNLRKQYVTYWVCYQQEGDVITVLGAYSHRMDIESKS
jgi:Fe-S oxidoreductase